MKFAKHLAVMLTAVTLTATGVWAQTEFTGAVSSDWDVAGNWTAGVPTFGTTASVGTVGHADVSASITGTADCNGLDVAVSANGSLDISGILTVGADASVVNRMRIGVGDTASATANVTISGTINANASIFNVMEDEHHSIDIGGGANANVTITGTGVINAVESCDIGKDDRWQGGYETHVTMESGAQINSGWTTIGLGGDVYPQILHMDAGSSINYASGNGVMQVGGTHEVHGGEVFIGGYRVRNYTPDPNDLSVCKLIGGEGTRIVATGLQYVSGGVALDVSEFTIPDNQWVVVATDPEGGWTGANPSAEVCFVPGTSEAWEWQMVWGNWEEGMSVADGPFELSVRKVVPLLMGDCNRSGYVDDDDLSLLLANWHATTTWDYGNLSDNDTPPGVMGYVDDDDLSLLLANWHAGTAPMGGDAVPEPGTIALLAIGGFGALIRKRR